MHIIKPIIKNNSFMYIGKVYKLNAIFEKVLENKTYPQISRDSKIKVKYSKIIINLFLIF